MHATAAYFAVAFYEISVSRDATAYAKIQGKALLVGQIGAVSLGSEGLSSTLAFRRNSDVAREEISRKNLLRAIKGNVAGEGVSSQGIAKRI